jgi:hypothetical protein
MSTTTPITPVALPVREGVSMCASTSDDSSDGPGSIDSAMATRMQQMVLQQRKLEAKMMEMQQQHERELAATAQLAALGGQGDPACAALLQSMFAFGS